MQNVELKRKYETCLDVNVEQTESFNYLYVLVFPRYDGWNVNMWYTFLITLSLHILQVNLCISVTDKKFYQQVGQHF